MTLIMVQLVVKSQILAGGRGLGTFQNGFKGGVHMVKADQVEDIAGTEFFFFIIIFTEKLDSITHCKIHLCMSVALEFFIHLCKI